MTVIIDGTAGVTFPAGGVGNLATTGTLALQSDGIGFSQTWQSVTGSRALSTTYYNTTGKPIMAFVRLTCGTSEVSGAFVLVNGVSVGAGSSAANGQSQVTFIVPPSQSYEVQANSGSPTLGTWTELR
jgi:hypothetical protein